MNKTTITLALLVPAAFFTGQFLSSKAPVAPSYTPEVSYNAGVSAKTGNVKKSVINPTPTGTIHQVKDGQLIMDAVKAAQPGDVIQVWPGTYTETVYIDKDNIRISGVIVEGKRPKLFGDSHLNDAILYSGNNVVVENFLITKYKGNGIMGQAGNNFEIRNNIIEDTGVYGIFPQLG